MSFHKIVPVKKHHKPAPAPKKPAKCQPARPAPVAKKPERRPVGNK
ncbi:hypothetical protein OG762_23955 [Streptomyces sp. NBC_01136]|nr:hypothetical protein OG762_23955 [Streptomyces sp. NBC_01136]